MYNALCRHRQTLKIIILLLKRDHGKARRGSSILAEATRKNSEFQLKMTERYMLRHRASTKNIRTRTGSKWKPECVELEQNMSLEGSSGTQCVGYAIVGVQTLTYKCGGHLRLILGLTSDVLCLMLPGNSGSSMEGRLKAEIAGRKLLLYSPHKT